MFALVLILFVQQEAMCPKECLAIVAFFWNPVIYPQLTQANINNPHKLTTKGQKLQNQMIFCKKEKKCLYMWRKKLMPYLSASTLVKRH